MVLTAPTFGKAKGGKKGKAKKENKSSDPALDVLQAEKETPTYSAPGADFLTGKGPGGAKKGKSKALPGKLKTAPSIPKVVGGKFTVDPLESEGSMVVSMAEQGGEYTVAKAKKEGGKKALLDKADDFFESIGEIGETYSKVKSIFEGSAPAPSFGGGGSVEAPAPSSGGAPGWLLPVAIGAGALVLVFVLKGRR